MRNDNDTPNFYEFKIALCMLKQAIRLYFTSREHFPKEGDPDYWYAIGYHLIGGSKYLLDRQYDAIRLFRHFDDPPTPDEVTEIRRGVLARISEGY